MLETVCVQRRCETEIERMDNKRLVSGNEHLYTFTRCKAGLTVWLALQARVKS